MLDNKLGTSKASVSVLMNGKRLSADAYKPDDLMVVISRDPQKIGEMSSGQHWQSCMAEGGINFRYVPADIEAGSLVAYVVSKDDPEARYPLMRQLLKPFHNDANGKTVLIPAHVYGSAAGKQFFYRKRITRNPQ